MPVQLSVKVRDAELVKKRFEDLTAEIPKISEGRLRGRMESAKKRVTTYPPRYAGQPEHVWASEKQRRYVMWAISTGRIRVPYQRTGRFMDSWNIAKIEGGYTLRSTSAAAKHIVGTARDPGRQYHLHKTRWTPLRVAIEDAIKELPKDIEKNITMIARKRGF
ncbi:MAG TPA: hypothetical protein VLH56_08945 [Dissulfurispiraceae bacterium]|nr:hypothetical protein [Dissulfurispiraceae bacterium]